MSDDDVAAWLAALAATPVVAHPCVTPGFATAVGVARDDTRVAMMRDDEGRRGFIAFNLVRRALARPVGLHLCDWQAVVSEPGFEWTGDALLSASGLSGFEFDHVPIELAQLRPHHRVIDTDPVIDLSQGYEAWLQARSSKLRYQLRRARRRLEEEHGHVTTTADTGGQYLDTLLDWKRDQYRRTRAPDALAEPWTRRVVHELVSGTHPGVAGEIAALVVGERPTALHLGLRADPIMASWIPAYDQAAAAAMPGLTLLDSVVKNASASNVEAFNLGRGRAEYKERMKSFDRDLGEGWIGRVSRRTRAKDVRRRVAAAILSSPAGPVARTTRDSLRRVASRVRP